MKLKSITSLPPLDATAGEGDPTAPPEANAGMNPAFKESKKADPHFCTEDALITYSPLDNLAKILSEVLVPAPLTFPLTLLSVPLGFWFRKSVVSHPQ